MTTHTGIPRPEHPRPQFERSTWQNLNGAWTYEFDYGKSGMHPGRELFGSSGFHDEITVPFCPESSLSGVCHKDFVEAIWYHRKLDIPFEWANKRIILHFGGVDYESELFINGISAGTHSGGTVSFEHDITRLVEPGQTHDLVVRALDELRLVGKQPSGKQCPDYKSRGCLYTRTTGIWQTVWIEAVHPCGLQRVHIVPDLDSGRFLVIPLFLATKQGLTFRAVLKDTGSVVATAHTPAAQGASVSLHMKMPKAWRPKDPFLYDLQLEVLDANGRVLDSVNSYAGLRKVHTEDNRIFLNNEPVYLRMVLDQGFYPEGIWTAPTDEALKRDIELSMAAGFNGARLHQKVFEERFHYWADRLGYLTWGESASWGCDVNDPAAARNFLSEWREILLRDRNHPSIIAWTPFNETANVTDTGQHARTHRDAYDTCRALDPMRPVNDASGYVHVKTDLWTVHNYEQSFEKLGAILTPGREKGVFRNLPDRETEYDGQPYLVDEYGGIKWIPPDRRAFADNSWGYGDAPRSIEEFYSRLEGLTNAILGQEHICGYCYTQLTDVEQEQNGIYNYNRSEKFDMERIRKIFAKTPSG